MSVLDSLAILTPAIIDQECIEKSQQSILENIVNCNLNKKFLHFVHLDNHLRSNKRYKGDPQKILKIYQNSYKNCPNVSCFLAFDEPRKGLIETAFILFQEFLKFNVEYCLILEDDTTLHKNLSLDDIENVIKEKNNHILHLSFGIEASPNLGGSVEKHWIDKNPKKISNFICHTRPVSEGGLSWNGTFFHKNHVKSFINEYKRDSKLESDYPEDQIYRSLKKIDDLFFTTLFYEKDHEKDDSKKDDYIWEGHMPKSSHVIFDETRWFGGRSKAML